MDALTVYHHTRWREDSEGYQLSNCIFRLSDMADQQTIAQGSKEATDIEETPVSKHGTKRIASRGGTRSIASLTPEQLSRKRANDREAQRSIRQRTKKHIEELEQRIRVLSQDQEARNFEQMKRRNAELEEELRQLKGLLRRSEGSKCSSLDLNPPSLDSRYNMDKLEAPHHIACSPSWGPQYIEGPSPPYSSLPTSSAGDLVLSSSFAPDHSGLPSAYFDPGSSRSEILNEAEVGIRNLTSLQTVPGPIARRGPMSRQQFKRSRSYPHGSFTLPSSNLPLGINGLVNSIRASPLGGQSTSPSTRPLTISVNGIQQYLPPTCHPMTLHQIIIPPRQQQQNRNGLEMTGQFGGRALPAWELPLQLLGPAGPVAKITLGLIHRQKSMATEHTLGNQLIGPYHPDLRPLVGPEMSYSIHPVPSILSDLFQRLEYVGFAEKAGALLLVYHFVQWQILPTKETYQNIPDWFRPRLLALVTAHSLWSSFLIWGGLRDVVIGDQQRYATEEFMNLYQNCVTVNWPFRDEDILVDVGEEVRVTDAFKRHVETQANWSLGEPFHRRYPELKDLYRLS